MPNSPTIVSAALSDKELQASINQMVANFDKGLQTMLEHSNEYVGKIQESLQKIGNTNFGAKGSNDGGVVKQTKQHKELTEAVSKETQKLQDLQQSLSGASDREQNFISQKERAANTIAQENELLSKQQSELAALKTQQQALANSESLVADAESKRKAAVATLDAKMKELTETQNRLLQKGSGITPNEKKLIGIDQATIQLIARIRDELSKLDSTINGVKYSKGEFSNRFAGLDTIKRELETNIRNWESYRSRSGINQEDAQKIDVLLQKYKEYLAVVDELHARQGRLEKNHPVFNYTDAYNKYYTSLIPVIKADRDLTEAEDNVYLAINKSSQASQQKAQIDAQVAAKEKEIAETKGRIATATKEQSEADKNASQAAKEKANIQGQIANQEKQVAEAKKQLTTATQQHTDAETKSSRATKEKTMTLDQQASAINTVVQSEKKYTDEVLRQAAAIRSSKEWQEKGHVVIGDVNYYDKERANVSKRDKQLLLSLEEQIVQAQQNEAEAARRAAQETRNQAQAQQQVQQAALGTARIVESVHEMQRRSASFSKGNASIPTFTVELESAKRLSDRLKELREQYNNMNFGQRFGKEGQAIAQQIREITRQGQRLNNELNRPTKKEVFGLSEKTLDDIAYKMRQLASYRSGLDANAQHNEIRRVNYEYDVLKKKMDEIMQKNSQMISSNTALGRSWNYMKNRLAFYFTVGASTQFVKNLIEVRSQYEMNERALGILVDSAERGTQIFRELSDMALVSPYTLIELSSAAKQLTAYDVAAKDVVDTTRRLADMASAVGVPVERLTYALGQIKAYGYLNSRDARMFANAGIPLVKELADHYTRLEGRLVSTADIYDRIKKKAIDYNDVMQVMNEMTDEGGKFYDFQAKMADTLKVQLANLTLAWNNMLNDLGNSQQGLLTSGIGALKELFLHWKDLDRILTNLAVTIGTAKAAQILLNMSFGKGTLAAIKNISAIEGNTAAMYENALSKSNLSKAEARWLISTNRSNVALRAAMVNMKLLTAEEAKAAASTTVLGVKMGWLGRIMKTNFFGLASVVRGAAVGMEMLGKAMLSIVTNPVFLSITAAMALVDALLYYNQIAEKTAEMNKAIADNAKEASEAIGNYLKDSVNIGNRAKAAQGVLSVSEGQKAWESIREQIELSSDAASVFISKLLEEEDINKRVKEGFDVAESIREATNAMAGLNAEALKVSQDSWLWGAFGEGLAEDLEDYIEAVQRGRKNGANIGSKYFAAGEYNEAMRELTAFANDAETIIRDRLGAGVKDAVQLKEAVERVKKEVIAANPQIKGEVKKWFDVEVDRMMAERFGGVYNELSSIQSQFIEHIKHDSGAALRRLSDDILDTSKELDDDVLGAISKAWDKLKDELPAESQDLISKLQKQMDENPLTLRVLLLQAGEQQIRDAIQKDYEQHFYDSNIGEKPTRPKDVGSLWGDYKGDYKAFAAAQEKHEKEMVEYNQKNAEWEAKRAEYVAKYGDFNKKNDETRAKWAKRVNDEIKAADAEEKAAKHARESLEAELSLEERKTDARYLSAVQEEQAAKDRKSAAQEAWNYEKLYQEEKGKGRKGSKKDPLLDALKQEISLVEKLQGDYDKLSKSGASQSDALETIRGAYGKTIRLLNTQLGKYGLPQLDISQLITGKDPNKTLAHFKQTLDTLVSKGLLTLERSKELEAVVEKFTLSAKTYNLDMITKGLNNELGKLKDEYELAVELDADPELGNVFASMMGIDMESLPHTVKEYADQYSKYLNKYLKGKNSSLQFTGDELRGLTRDDITAFREQVDAGSFNQEWFDAIKKAYDDIQGKRKKDIDDTEKWKNSLIEKYGNLQDKLTKIYKNSVQQQVNAVKSFGTENQKSEIVRLQLRLEATDDPAELANINLQIAEIVKDVTDKNPIALKVVTSSKNQEEIDTSKAYWEDFKNSELYAMTFEDMANNSTRAIQLIMDKLDGLKDKVKEDPASMKALIKSLEDAQKELNARDPFGGVARSLRDMANASQEARTAQEALWRAEVDIEQAQQEVDNAEDGTPEEQASAQQKLADAIQRRTTAQVKLTQAENKGKKAQENLKSSLQGVTNQLGDVKSLFDTVSKLFRAGGDDETADAIDAISEGFSTMTTVIMGVVAAMALIKMSHPELLAIAAALSVIVGLVSFLNGQKNKKIDEEIKDSELAVNRLENQYKKLQAAVEDAYGTMAYAAEKAAVYNKKLQLEEMRRQLRLEQSRDSKDRDDDKIESLKGQIIDLEREIQKATDNWINDMLGISSVGDAAEQLVSSMIDAFRQGEDYMGKFYDSFDEMIENMIMKAIATKVIGEYIESMWNDIKSKAEARSKKEAQDVEETQSKYNEAQNLYDAWVGGESTLRAWMGDEWYEEELHNREERLKKAEEEKEKALKAYEKAITPTPSDVEGMREDAKEKSDFIKEWFDATMEEWGIAFGDKSGKNLSNLQQGIQGITEDTAGALEGITNGISQQSYLQSDLLTQIRDTILGFDLDIQMGVLSEILLQLQSSYQIQMSIRDTLQGWSNASGMAVRVEMV